MASGETTRLNLVGIGGDLDARDAVILDPAKQILIGRSPKGIQVSDPMVSIRHARIGWEKGRGYVITDLDSATGTWVDEECIRGESRLIGVGTRLRFGDVTYEVVKRPLLSRISVLALVNIAAVLFTLTLLLARSATQPPQQATLRWVEPIRMGGAGLPSTDLRLPVSYTRKLGINAREFRIRKVTDHDFNGLDEVWLVGPEAEHVVTFDVGGELVDLGEIPAGCVEMERGGAGGVGFPALDCEGETYVLVGGKLRGARHEGVVVWTSSKTGTVARAPELEEGEEAPQAKHPDGLLAHRVVLKGEEALAGFLNSRGINEPVHYLICEDALPGVRAQVVTATGRAVALSSGCLGQVRVTGTEEGGRPVVVAFTSVGRQALLDDITTFHAGNPDKLFLETTEQELIRQLSAPAGVLKGAARLTFEGPSHVFSPLATEVPMSGVRSLIPSDPRNPASPPAVVATLISSGRAEIDPPGCALLSVKTGPYWCHVGGGCVSSSTFLSIEEKGCGEPRTLLSVPYGGGAITAEFEGLEVRATATVLSSATGFEVNSAKVGYRSTSKIAP